MTRGAQLFMQAWRRGVLAGIVALVSCASTLEAQACDCLQCTVNGCAEDSTMAAAASTAGTYLVGLDFIQEPVATDGSFLFGFVPFDVTRQENNFVAQGAFAGRSAAEIQRSIVLAVEDSFRQVAVGDGASTLAVQIFSGRVPADLPGRRLNVVVGASSSEGWKLLGEAFSGAYDSALADDAYAAAVYLDEIDRLGSTHVTYDDYAGAIQAIAGTAAHEIGHLFDAEHVTVGPDWTGPYPLMAIESTGLPTAARLSQRQFSATLPAEQPITELLTSNIGIAARADFNMDGSVDGLDIGGLISNFGRLDALHQEGDANGDHRVDGLDIGALIAQWSGAPTASVLAEARAMSVAIPEPSGTVSLCVAAWAWTFGARATRRRTTRA